jgi:hypothetical protein
LKRDASRRYQKITNHTEHELEVMINFYCFKHRGPPARPGVGSSLVCNMNVSTEEGGARERGPGGGGADWVPGSCIRPQNPRNCYRWHPSPACQALHAAAAGLQIVRAGLFFLHSHTESAQLLPLESESYQSCTALMLEDHLPLCSSCKDVATPEPNYHNVSTYRDA